MDKITCINCKTTKNVSEYYKHKQMSSGYLNKCKTCCKEQAEKRRIEKEKDPEWMFNERLRHRLKSRKYREKNRDKHLLRNKKSINTLYVKARTAANSVPVPKGHERHHWSYNEEHFKDVIIMTKKDHCHIHNFMELNKELGFFIDVSGNLLNTKKKSLDYYKKVLKINDKAKYREVIQILTN